jgi:GNAT superfamily N-acetyltransferase
MMGKAMSSIRLVPGDHTHVDALARRLRPIDRIECEAMGRSASQALRHGLAVSAQVWTALVDGEPHAMFGVVVESAAGGDAVPWFLGSDLVARHGRALIAQGPAILAAMHRHGIRLRNFVSSENRAAIRLLEHWGFTVEQELVVMRGIAFRRFIREIM